MARLACLEMDLKECSELFGFDLCELTDEGTLSLNDDCHISFDTSSYPKNTTVFLNDDYSLSNKPIQGILGELEVTLAVLPHLGVQFQLHGELDDGLLKVSFPVDIADCDSLFLKCWGVFNKESLATVHIDYEVNDGSLIHTSTAMKLDNVAKAASDRQQAQRMAEAQEASEERRLACEKAYALSPEGILARYLAKVLAWAVDLQFEFNSPCRPS